MQRIFIQDLETGNWEVAELKKPLQHEYEKHPLITFILEYDSVTEQKAFNDSLRNIDAIIIAAQKVKDSLLNKNPITITNLKNNETRKIEKIT